MIEYSQTFTTHNSDFEVFYPVCVHTPDKSLRNHCADDDYWINNSYLSQNKGSFYPENMLKN